MCALSYLSIDLYAKNWSKREQVELKYLSEWKDQLKELVADRISNLKGYFKVDRESCYCAFLLCIKII